MNVTPRDIATRSRCQLTKTKLMFGAVLIKDTKREPKCAAIKGLAKPKPLEICRELVAKLRTAITGVGRLLYRLTDPLVKVNGLHLQ